jgi:aspartyl aminopeptidase
MARPNHDLARQMCAYIDSAPSPFHAVLGAARELQQAGYRRLDELAAWDRAAGGAFVVRGGSLVAWHLPQGAPPHAGFRILGAHTDSPNLRLKPRPDTGRAGFRQLGVEVYGGVLRNSWLDRDLGLSGRVFVRGARGPEERLLKIDRPVLRVPQLAIHLDREINEKGLQLNAQQHLVPVLGLSGQGDERHFSELLCAELGVERDSVLSWDLMCHDTQPAQLVGWSEELVSAPRLDNLCSSFLGLRALLEARGDGTRVGVLCLFDHEEVGSASSRGADSPMLSDLLERTVLTRGGTREDYHRAIADSLCLSADMAHGTHPNYPERHEPDHPLFLNKGPVIKLNANQRYATEGETEAAFQTACERADVPYQKWVNRTDLACGSTIGPLTAARLGIRTVDVGNPMLAMHSIRELCGSTDPAYMRAAMTAFLEG